MKFLSVAFASIFVLAASAKQCSSSQFNYWSSRTGDCCLPRGGSPNPPSPPSHKECPGHGWYWHGGYSCCVPTNPNPPSKPRCRYGDWDEQKQCCHKPTPPGNPTPSGGYHRQWKKRTDDKIETRNWRSKTLSCAASETVCNVSGDLTAATWACVDTQKDVNFCGGCGIHGDAGQDCAAISNSWNVGCESGKCRVYTCEPGFRVSRSGKSCVAID